MSEQLQLRRGPASAIATFTGAAGEVVVDTTNNRLVLQDGATAGGFAAAKLSEVTTQSRTPVNDVSYTALTSDRIIAFTAISAARAVALPASGSYPPGQALIVVDESGSCSGSNTITLNRNGTDTIDGAASLALSVPYGFVSIESSGAGKWTVLSPTGASATTPAMDGTATIGVSLNYARADHVHPSDATRAALAGATFTGALVAVAGSTTVTPLKLQSGALNATAAAGGVEFDGTCFYGSAAASTRQIVVTEQIEVLSSAYTLTSQTAAQKLLNGSSNGAVTLAVGAYEFECMFSLSSLSATSGSFGFALGGTATFAQAWEAIASQPAALATATSPQATFNTAANTSLTAASTNTYGHALIKGVIRVTTSGTIIPQVSLTVAAAAVVGVNSYFKISPLGASSVSSVGNWS